MDPRAVQPPEMTLLRTSPARSVLAGGHVRGVRDSGSMSEGKLVVRCFPQGSVLGPASSNIFSVARAGATRLRGAVGLLEGRGATRRDRDRRQQRDRADRLGQTPVATE